MKVHPLLLFTLTTLFTCCESSVVSGFDNLVNLLDPDNFNVTEFTQAAVAFTASFAVSSLPVKAVAKYLPSLSIKENLDIMNSTLSDHLPNYNTEYTADGIKDGKLGWLVEADDRTSEDPVILYAHGGSYVIGLYPTTPWFLSEVYKNASDDRLSILLLDYTLAPNSTFPHQLSEYTMAYNNLTDSSDNIIVAGDSAGAHLVLNFIRHQSYKRYSGVVKASKQKPEGAFLLSPWVNMYPDPSNGTYKSNNHKDILTPQLMQHCAETFLPNKTLYHDVALNPFNDKKAKWEKTLPKSTFVSVGENEIMYDDIVHWASDLGGLGKSEVYVSPEAIHDSALSEPETSDITPKVAEYLVKLFKK